MRCYACNQILKTSEAIARFKSGGYTEMCNVCIDASDLRRELAPKRGQLPEEALETSELDIEDSFDEEEDYSDDILFDSDYDGN